jgi:hypothetical protein
VSGRTSRLEEVGTQDDWRCWLCDEPVDQSRSVNDPLGPSVDSMTSDAKSAKGARRTGQGQPLGSERLAHRGCNSSKGATKPVVSWPSSLFVADPAPLIAVAERLSRKGGREVVARCPSRSDAELAGDWLVDRFSRLAPTLAVSTTIEPGGGQYMLVLVAATRR